MRRLCGSALFTCVPNKGRHDYYALNEQTAACVVRTMKSYFVRSNYVSSIRYLISCARIIIPNARIIIPCARILIPCARNLISCARIIPSSTANASLFFPSFLKHGNNQKCFVSDYYRNDPTIFLQYEIQVLMAHARIYASEF